MESSEIIILFIVPLATLYGFICMIMGKVKEGEPLLLFALVTFLCFDDTKMHIVYCILIGLGAAIFLYMLMSFLVTKIICTIFFTALWTFVVYSIVTDVTSDRVWIVTLTIIGFVISLFTHIYALFVDDEVYINDTQNVHHVLSEKEYQRLKNQEWINEWNRKVAEEARQKRKMEAEYSKDASEESNSNSQEISEEQKKLFELQYYLELFENCDTEEKMKKRYKELLKIYHPDNISGSNEKTNKITEAYEILLENL
jgi:hypothetical protein